MLLLADARNIVSGVDALEARAKLMAWGLESELSVVVDVFFPTAVVSAAAKAFAIQFPLTPLRLFVEGLGAAYQPVLDGRVGRPSSLGPGTGLLDEPSEPQRRTQDGRRGACGRAQPSDLADECDALGLPIARVHFSYGDSDRAMIQAIACRTAHRIKAMAGRGEL